jgi:hypothetical protein
MPIHGYVGNVITANPTAPTSSVATGVWTTEQQLQAVAAGNWPMALTQISRSLRFNSADSAYLNRTFSTPTSQNTWTISCWVKRGALSSQQTLFSAGTSNRLEIIFASDNTLQIADASTNFIVTTPVYRDPSSWYHIVIRANGSSSAMQVYVNGTITTNSTTNNLTTSYWNASGVVGYIGSLGGFSSNYFNGYMTEIYFIDGQALTPSSFGFNSSDTGVWSPKQYTGPFGTNGFYVNFSDNSDTTSTTLGKDYSGNGNNWTPNNFSVAAGAGNDSMVDSPTAYGTDTGVGGSVRGNYATLNPLDQGGASTTTNGNLQFNSTTSNVFAGMRGTLGFTSGKWYFEAIPTTFGVGAPDKIVRIGVTNTNYNIDASSGDVSPTGGSAVWDSRDNGASAFLYLNGTSSDPYGYSFTVDDVVMVAFDADTRKIWFGKNGVWNTGDPAAGTSEAATLTSGFTYTPFADGSNTTVTQFNFGQRAFSYTAPSGFKALCTTNLPTPTIGATSTTQANDYFNIVLYTGTGSSLGVTGVGFQPDWVWIKERNAAADHGLYDAVRGVQNQLESNTTTAETTEATGLTAFGTDGFTVGALAQLNTSADTYVAWNWNAGGSNATNTSGTITSTVRANTTSGFSIVTYTGTGSNATVGHGLGVAPSMVIVRNRVDAGSIWPVWHNALAGTEYLQLQGTDAKIALASMWNSTVPTSTVFSVGTVGQAANANTKTYVAYCFAPVAGYSAFGSYTGNGSADGPFVYTGFRPRYVLVKNANDVQNWFILDTARSTFNLSQALMRPNTSDAEATSFGIDIISNGFKVRNNDPSYNANGNTIIYACFAESPFKYALAR